MRPRLLQVAPFRFESGEFDLTVSLIIYRHAGLRQRGKELACAVEFRDGKCGIAGLNGRLGQPLSRESFAEPLWTQSNGGDCFLRQNQREIPLLALLRMEAQIRIKLIST